jgi:hypothetical protein
MPRARGIRHDMFFTLHDSAWTKGALSFLICYIFCTANLEGQIVQSGRLELPLNIGEERSKAASLGINGLMLYRRLAGKKDDLIDLVRIDTTLKHVWNGFIAVEKNMNILQVQPTEESFFILLRDRNFIVADFEVIKVSLQNGEYIRYPVKNLIPFNPSEFLITGQAALMGGYFNYRPIVLYFNFKTQRSKVLPGFFNEPGELNQIKTYDDGSVDVIVCAKNFEKRKSLWIRNYDAEGDLIKTTILQPEEKKNLIFGRSVKLPNGDLLVTGVYGRFSDYSRGIFVASINQAGEYHIAYYNFAQLDNFFSYMKARKEKRIKERIERKTIRGKKIKFNYRFIIHDIIPYQGQYIMTGEAFYPHYRYITPGYSAYRTGPATPGFYLNNRNDMVFDGYQYTHAVVIGFDEAGKVKWDNSFEINDVKTMNLQQFVKIKTDKDRIVMMYLFQNTLRAKIIHDSQVLEGKTKDPIKAGAIDRSTDVLNENESLDFWYGNYFFADGVQQMKQPSGKFRRVFFVNKITYK